MREKLAQAKNLHEKNSSSPTWIHMTFSLVPHFCCMDFMHKVHFSCMDFMHKVYFTYKDSTNQLWLATDPCVSIDRPNRTVRNRPSRPETSEIVCTHVDRSYGKSFGCVIYINLNHRLVVNGVIVLDGSLAHIFHCLNGQLGLYVFLMEF